MIKAIKLLPLLLVAIFGLASALEATTYVGSIRSNKYHYLSCYWAGRIYPQNRIFFSSACDARASGYVPCKVCNPPWCTMELGEHFPLIYTPGRPGPHKVLGRYTDIQRQPSVVRHRYWSL